MTTIASPTNPAWALYGATGVTGRILLAKALAAGLRPRLVGRDAGRLQPLAAPAGLGTEVAALDDAAGLDRALAGCAVLVNVAGPFALTFRPLADACLRQGIAYLDLNGELASLRELLALDAPARAARVALVGGAGFGIAATDSLARRVSEALGGAEHLRISVAASSGYGSDAVAASTLAVLAGGGFEVARGCLTPCRLARRRWQETAPDGTFQAFASAPLADLAGALHATGTADIVAGVPMPAARAVAVSIIAPILPLLMRIPAVGRQLANTGGHAATGNAPAAHSSRAWVSGTRGARQYGLLMAGGEAFSLAADIALHALRAHLAGTVTPGAHTPATAYGVDWLDAVTGVRVVETHNR